MTQIWLAVDKDGTENISVERLVRDDDVWDTRLGGFSDYIILPKGSIEKLIGRKLTWDDEAVLVEGERR